MTMDEFKKDIKWRTGEAKMWYEQHKTEIAVAAPIIAFNIIELIKILGQKSLSDTQRDIRERYIFDKEVGHYYETRRPPKDKEWLLIDERILQGEHVGFILMNMGLLKGRKKKKSH